MKLVNFFALVLMAFCVAGQQAMQKCYYLSQYLSAPDASNTCAYIEDAVRCGIKDLKLTEASATQADVDEARNTSNDYFTRNNCSQTFNFDVVFNEVKARPELLVVQACVETALIKGQGNPPEACTYVEEAVEFGIKVLSLDKGYASERDMEFGRNMAPRYLKRYSCSATFDTILERLKNSGPTASPIGWLTAIMAASILMFTTVF